MTRRSPDGITSGQGGNEIFHQGKGVVFDPVSRLYAFDLPVSSDNPGSAGIELDIQMRIKVFAHGLEY